MTDETPSKPSRRDVIRAGAATIAAVQGPIAAAQLTTASPAEAQPAPTFNVADYIIARLRQQNVTTLFGIPGVTCDPIFAAAEKGGTTNVVASSDFEAGYSADGYARVRGLGAVAATYGVGMMSLIGTISGAYAERSPVVVINGGPTAGDLANLRDFGVYFSHSNGREKSDFVMFGEVTELAVRAASAAEVPMAVDNAIRTALVKKRPVYIEIAKDIWEDACARPQGSLDVTIASSGEEPRIVAEIASRLQAASQPVFLAGIEVDRFGLADEVAALITKLRVPWASTLLAKSVIPETTPGFIGVFGGSRSPPSVVREIMSSDCLVALGCVTGLHMLALVTKTVNGKRTARETVALAANDRVRLWGRDAGAASLKGIVAGLGQLVWSAEPGIARRAQLPGLSFEQRRQSIVRRIPARAEAGEPGMTYDETIGSLSAFLDNSFITVTDTSLSMYPAADLNVVGRKAFVCNAVWQSIGYSLGAAVGIGLGQSRRPLVICGDGGFQTCAQALSTMAARKIRAIVIVLDNGQYGIEQWLLDPDYFGRNAAPPPLRRYLALKPWKYADFAKSLGFSSAASVKTLAEFKTALNAARDAPGPALISVTIKMHNLPSGVG